MKLIKEMTFDEERAFYESSDIHVLACAFEGPMDGESAFKESSNIFAENCRFDLRYPFWHCSGVRLKGSRMTELCRAPLWYTSDITVENCKLRAVKAVRECKGASFTHSGIVSSEFGWFSEGLKFSDTAVEGEYFLMRSKDIELVDSSVKGKYSFQYVENAVIDNCRLDTKDAFWHSKNVTVKNSVVNGEYVGWYSEGLTLENCVITGTQPFCYCRGLKLINCKLEDADLAFERSHVEAEIKTHVISIKNPKSGSIRLPSVGEIIDGSGDCEIVITEA